MSVLCVILGKRVYVLMSAFSHNQKITNPKTITKEKTSNCVDKAKCLLSQNCLINNIICKAVLTSTNPFSKEKSTSVQLKLHSTCNTQTKSTKQTLSY